jgi:hypothetical protein
MAQPLHVGLPIIYALAEEWMWRRHVLGYLAGLGGIEDPDLDPLETALTAAGPTSGMTAQQRAAAFAAIGGAIDGW